MINNSLTFFGKSFSKVSNTLNLGSGSTWPGHVALNLNKNFIKETISPKTKIILIAGTNGKTTTSLMISEILRDEFYSVAANNSGANLLNGIASTIISNSSIFSARLKTDYLVLEVDENSLPVALENLNPSYIIALNLFRDQLDRYGEIDSIITRWRKAFQKLENKTTLVLNADDPQVSFLGKDLKAKVLYFGLNENNQKEIEHGADSIYCPKCSHSLDFKTVTFSHLGDWSCPNCGLKRPKLNISSFKTYPLLGTYNKYNMLASVLIAKNEGISDQEIEDAVSNFKPAFGRQEEFEVDRKKIKIFLSKNPTSFNESLSTISDLKAKNILIVLNDRIPDGRDVSWIWDVDSSNLKTIPNTTLSGDRVYDMGLRLKYSDIKNFEALDDLSEAVKKALEKTSEKDTLFILPTYSAMLEVRKILKGRKIL